MPVLAAPGARLHYEELGRGEPLVALHGGLGLDSTYLRRALDPLADDLHLILPDVRGHGRSPPCDLSKVTMGDLVNDVDALRRHLDLERVSLLGHSFGGFLAQEYALARPLRVERLILVCTAPNVAFDARMRERMDALPCKEAVYEWFEGDFSDDAGFAAWMDKVAPIYPASRDGALSRDLLSGTRFSYAGLQLGNRLMETFDTAQRLARLDVPTLVILGRHDVLFDPQRVAGFEALPKVKRVTFENSGHFPFWEESERFRDEVLGWMGSLRAPPAAGAS